MDLFAEKKILTVSQLTALVRELIEENFDHVWVEGEVSNLSLPSSGHIYFTLKDSGATLRCVMFRSSAKAVKFRLSDGMKVIVRGRMTVYDQRGDYQLITEYIEPQGFGALQLAFQQLKEKLAKEGLFAEKRKKPLPLLPSTIGIVTSPTGAAIHDILNVIGRRHSSLGILIAPVRVQGEGAAAEIAAAIADLNRIPGIDVIIVARGGGSLEDLWAFNEEVVARAIAASRLPVISAVGHEVDITISDLVADLRAPTPSAAAELVVSSKEQLLADCASLERRLAHAVNRSLHEKGSRLEILKLSLKDPESVIERFMLKVDDLQTRSEKVLSAMLASGFQRMQTAGRALEYRSPEAEVKRMFEHVGKLEMQALSHIRTRLETARASLSESSGRLESLSPLAVLSRGYALVSRPLTGLPVKSVEDLVVGEDVELQLSDGCSLCNVRNKTRKLPYNLDSGQSRN
jgi:exodeoxyribonuclease VII large subunit